ncbi:hypothetical protein BP5796_00651 [Coleophoma crateriformis]|uniref:AB hydrolase-1 domain-containing protein n=1 Tax=Coleophoma crateriformis TaxID=565419 RepID=A0A3D8TA76_9HELO|nr:hypothetical protein BP5796_00651 [Coleophoma crateriformis]
MSSVTPVHKETARPRGLKKKASIRNVIRRFFRESPSHAKSRKRSSQILEDVAFQPPPARRASIRLPSINLGGSRPSSFASTLLGDSGAGPQRTLEQRSKEKRNSRKFNPIHRPVVQQRPILSTNELEKLDQQSKFSPSKHDSASPVDPPSKYFQMKRIPPPPLNLGYGFPSPPESEAGFDHGMRAPGSPFPNPPRALSPTSTSHRGFPSPLQSEFGSESISPRTSHHSKQPSWSQQRPLTAPANGSLEYMPSSPVRSDYSIEQELDILSSWGDPREPPLPPMNQENQWANDANQPSPVRSDFGFDHDLSLPHAGLPPPARRLPELPSNKRKSSSVLAFSSWLPVRPATAEADLVPKPLQPRLPSVSRSVPAPPPNENVSENVSVTQPGLVESRFAAIPEEQLLASARNSPAPPSDLPSRASLSSLPPEQPTNPTLVISKPSSTQDEVDSTPTLVISKPSSTQDEVDSTNLDYETGLEDSFRTFNLDFEIQLPSPCFTPASFRSDLSKTEVEGEVDDVKPAIILIPGSFARKDLYKVVMTKLEAAGYEVQFAELDSIISKDIPVEERPKAASLEDDADQINHMLTKLADQEKEILLVGHSYGGLPMTESCQSLTKLERTMQGKRGGVIALLYIAAFVPSAGESMVDMLAGISREHPVNNVTMDGPDYLKIDPELSASAAFSDFGDEEGMDLVNQMGVQSISSFGGKTTFEAWQHLPVSYLFAKNDQVNPYHFQQSMVEKIEKKTGRPVTVYDCDSGHCPNVTHPDRMVEVIRDVAGEADDD